MITSDQYVIENLESIALKFPYVDIVYQFDESNNAHFIKIGPDAIYQSDEFWEISDTIHLEFIHKFPLENMAFYSVEDYCPIDHVTWEHHALTNRIEMFSMPIGSWDQLLTKQYSQFFNPNFFYNVESFKSLYKTTVNIMASKRNLNLHCASAKSGSFKYHQTTFEVNSEVDKGAKPAYQPSGENNYALAA